MRINELSAVLALAGVAVQLYWRMKQFRNEQQVLAQHFSTVRELMEEVRWRRPIKRLRLRREITDLISDRPQELLDYRRVYWELVAWVLILVAGLYGVGAAFTDRVGW